LLKIEKVGVCGSDVHYYETGRIGSQIVQLPFVLGHECAGHVLEIGPAVSRVKVGDEVAIDPAIVCHECDQCLAGRKNTCRKLRFLGCPGQADGCLSEYLVMPQESLYPLNGRINLDEAVLSEPLSIGVYAVQQSQLSAGAAVAILGCGPIGLSVFCAAKVQKPAAIFMTDKIDRRLEVAHRAGASWIGNPDRQDIAGDILRQVPAGMDVVYECAGEQDALDQAIELLKPGGKLMLIGIPRTERVSFIIDKIRRKEITLINVRRQNHCVQSAIDMIAGGEIDVSFMITHRFALTQTQQAFDLVAGYHDGVVKALIEFPA
jgi:L-iditol 2-dehydrogenase